MWPPSFKAIKAKIDEYASQKKKRAQQKAEREAQKKRQKELEELWDEAAKPNFDYQLPELLPPQSYAECISGIETFAPRLLDTLSSPSRKRFTGVIKATSVHLNRGSIHELEIL
jgi:tyrosyl-tRNA synthetase